MSTENKPAMVRATELVTELDDASRKYGMTIEQVYKVASEHSREEYFTEMYKLLREITA